MPKQECVGQRFYCRGTCMCVTACHAAMLGYPDDTLILLKNIWQADAIGQNREQVLQIPHTMPLIMTVCCHDGMRRRKGAAARHD